MVLYCSNIIASQYHGMRSMTVFLEYCSVMVAAAYITGIGAPNLQSIKAKKIFRVCCWQHQVMCLALYTDADMAGPTHSCCQAPGLSELGGTLHSMLRHRPTTQDWLEQPN